MGAPQRSKFQMTVLVGFRIKVKGKIKKVLNSFFLVFAVKNPGFGVGNFKQVEHGRLFDFVHGKFICVKAGKGQLSHGIKQVGIKCSRVIDFWSINNQRTFFF